MRKFLPLLAVALFFTASLANAQLGGTPPFTTNLNLTVGPEATLRIDTSNTTLSSTPGNFQPYTGTTNFTYFVRTSKSGGTGTIGLQVTTDFHGTGLTGPSLASWPTAGDALTYNCSVTSPATQCSGPVTPTLTTTTNVATFGANAHSTFAGNSGSVDWTLTNDPLYETGSYQAVVTFTISAT